MENSTHLIFSIVKKLETVTFRTLKIGAKLEKAKEKLAKLNKGTIGWMNGNSRVNQLYKELEESLDVSNIEKEIFKYVSQTSFKYADSYTKMYCSKIYNDIENGYYTHKQFVVAYMYECLFTDKKIRIKTLNLKRIKEILKLFTRKRFNSDIDFLVTVNESLSITNVQDYFKINNSGENIVYNLIKKEFVSPIFYLYYRRKFKNDEGIKTKSKEYLHFERLNNIIFKFLN